jgi:hypothetical protein
MAMRQTLVLLSWRLDSFNIRNKIDRGYIGQRVHSVMNAAFWSVPPRQERQVDPGNDDPQSPLAKTRTECTALNIRSYPSVLGSVETRSTGSYNTM